MTDDRQNRIVLVEAGIITVCMGVFGLFLHAGFPLVIISAGGLVCVCCIAGYRLVKNRSKPVAVLAAFFGISMPGKKSLPYVLIGVMAGCILAVTLRLWQNAPAVPGEITLFAATTAPLVGMSEELLFRGYMQNRLYGVNTIAAVIISALSHTIYKTSLMILPSWFNQSAIPFFAAWTFATGMLFGALSKKSGNVYPALAAHAVFDIIAYAAYAAAPRWLW